MARAIRNEQMAELNSAAAALSLERMRMDGSATLDDGAFEASLALDAAANEIMIRSGVNSRGALAALTLQAARQAEARIDTLNYEAPA